MKRRSLLNILPLFEKKCHLKSPNLFNLLPFCDWKFVNDAVEIAFNGIGLEVFRDSISK